MWRHTSNTVSISSTSHGNWVNMAMGWIRFPIEPFATVCSERLQKLVCVLDSAFRSVEPEDWKPRTEVSLSAIGLHIVEFGIGLGRKVLRPTNEMSQNSRPPGGDSNRTPSANKSETCVNIIGEVFNIVTCGMDLWMDLLTTYAYYTELQAFTALSLICTIYSSPLHKR
jgi:hypothetical protein